MIHRQCWLNKEEFLHRWWKNQNQKILENETELNNFGIKVTMNFLNNGLIQIMTMFMVARQTSMGRVTRRTKTSIGNQFWTTYQNLANWNRNFFRNWNFAFTKKSQYEQTKTQESDKSKPYKCRYCWEFQIIWIPMRGVDGWEFRRESYNLEKNLFEQLQETYWAIWSSWLNAYDFIRFIHFK